ncbi:hypothetical protein M407DRAFT_241012 [Tulasnella calospora MUT 4182]|uniref:Protein kinase domain-containing protein n=1 Tax=Tulasnella calospora MUT 4182 TaxID=1051891 RepID=A0A0C3QVK4_9AGAM|nr:hypothetical protein M407DRAFT_241012 [Tulasnella calospora MUT 4182]
MGKFDVPGYDVMDSDGQNLKSNNPTPKSEYDADDEKKCQEGETRNEESSVKGEGVVEEEGQKSTSETAGRLKAVAVKKMKIADDPMRVLGLTLREAEFLIEFAHKNIIALEGFIEDISNDILWLVFPWEDNGTLRDFVASRDWEIPERM